MKKQLLWVAPILFVAFALAGCGAASPPETDHPEPETNHQTENAATTGEKPATPEVVPTPKNVE